MSRSLVIASLLVACGHGPQGALADAARSDSPADGAARDALAADAALAFDGSPDAQPDAAADAALATDCLGCKLVLFGGFTFDDVVLADSWIYDGSWTFHNGAEPAPLGAAAAATYRDHALVFSGQTSNLMLSADLDVYSGQWGSYGQGPVPRSGAAASTLGDSFVVFGGSSTAGRIGDTWTWGIDTDWIQASTTGPSARTGASAATLGGEVVLFGGIDTGLLADTWAWNGTTWTAKSVTGPPPRAAAAMATLGTTIVLFGGYAGPNDYLADTWTWDGGAWTQHLVPGPTGRASAGMATANGEVVLFGGYGSPGGNSQGFTALADTWTWDGAAWTQHTGAAPPARSAPVLAAYRP